jgi:hypothetical protein
MTSLSRDWHVQDAESTPSQAASEDDHRDQQEALPDENGAELVPRFVTMTTARRATLSTAVTVRRLR